MRLLICGDRNWIDYDLIKKTVINFINEGNIIEVIIEGEAQGADKLGKQVAFDLNIPVEIYPALWIKYQKASGVIRNKQMLTEGKPDYVLAFHDNIENSKGTKHMVSITNKAQIPYQIISH